MLVALVDQPGVGAAVIELLLGARRPGRVTAAGYRGSDRDLRRGHPLVIDASLKRAAAVSASGDAGARDFLRAHPI